jgi:hypothetical protein
MTALDDALDVLAGHIGRWWDTATPTEHEDARALLSLDGPRRHWLGRAKGYSKTRDVAGISIIFLLTQMAWGWPGW